MPANIAEGQGFESPKQFHHHLSIAMSSLCELETHFIVAQRPGYVDEPALEEILERTSEVGRLINGLLRSLRS